MTEQHEQPQEEAVVERPYRAGVFGNVTGAEDAVNALMAAGFTVDQISVLCSDELKERHFKMFEHAQPAGTNTPAAAAIGSAVGATLGGIGTAAAGSVIGVDAMAAMSGAGLWTGGILGGFIGAMMTRGAENELSDFYQQGVQQGKILVAAHSQGENAPAELARAAAILAEKGAEPLPLREG